MSQPRTKSQRPPDAETNKGTEESAVPSPSSAEKGMS